MFQVVLLLKWILICQAVVTSIPIPSWQNLTTNALKNVKKILIVKCLLGFHQTLKVRNNFSIYHIFYKWLTVFFLSLFVDPELHNTCWLKKDVSDRIDKEGVTSGFITDECKGKKIRLKKRIHDCEIPSNAPSNFLSNSNFPFSLTSRLQHVPK